MGIWEKGVALTPEVLEKIDELLSEGLFEKTVRDLMNIATSSWEYWKKEAKKLEEQLRNGEITEDQLKDGDHRILKFLEILKKGRAKAIQVNVQNIQKAGKDPAHWQASAWYLERVEPEMFGRKQTIKHEGAIGVVDVELSEDEEQQFKENLSSIFGTEIE